MNKYEYLKLQGFPKNFRQVISDSQFKKKIGNSMSINVLVHLFYQIFICFKNIDDNKELILDVNNINYDL